MPRFISLLARNTKRFGNGSGLPMSLWRTGERTSLTKVAVVPVEIVGERPVVGDFEFYASVEFGDDGNFVDFSSWCGGAHEVPSHGRFL